MTDGAPDFAAENAQLRVRLERERRIRLEAESMAEQGTRLLYERQQQLEMMRIIAETANAAVSIDTCLQVTLDEWCRYTGWPVGHVYFVDPGEAGDLHSSRLWHLDVPEMFTEFRAVTERVILVRGEGLPGAVLASGKPLWVVDVSEATSFPRRRPKLNVHGAFAFPIRVGTATVAVAEFFSLHTEETNEAWLALADQVGSVLGRVFERLRAKDEFAQLSAQLVAASRQAGMAEIATGVLHNVGNVLNSVNLSASLILDRIAQSKVARLAQAVELLRAHPDDLAAFLTTDPRGKLLPQFFEAVAKELGQEQVALRQEAQSLLENVDHVKQIVAMQQSYVTVSGTRETLVVSELLDDALRMSNASLESRQIELVREFAEVPRVVADRHKALQILVNLLTNARQALESRPADRRIVLRIRPGDHCVRIEVVDNGAGIAAENLTKIFRHGFTTKKTGHGFGLHSCANAAKEMGGSLGAHSDGPGSGATFALELPLSVPAGSRPPMGSR